MKIIATSDGKISMRADEYLSHRTGTYGNFTLCSSEMSICTKSKPTGWIYKFDSAEEMLKASREIIEQLKSA
jgi:hypothetical protein